MSHGLHLGRKVELRAKSAIDAVKAVRCWMNARIAGIITAFVAEHNGAVSEHIHISAAYVWVQACSSPGEELPPVI